MLVFGSDVRGRHGRPRVSRESVWSMRGRSQSTSYARRHAPNRSEGVELGFMGRRVPAWTAMASLCVDLSAIPRWQKGYSIWATSTLRQGSPFGQLEGKWTPVGGGGGASLRSHRQDRTAGEKRALAACSAAIVAGPAVTRLCLHDAADNKRSWATTGPPASHNNVCSNRADAPPSAQEVLQPPAGPRHLAQAGGEPRRRLCPRPGPRTAPAWG